MLVSMRPSTSVVWQEYTANVGGLAIDVPRRHYRTGVGSTRYRAAGRSTDHSIHGRMDLVAHPSQKGTRRMRRIGDTYAPRVRKDPFVSACPKPPLPCSSGIHVIPPKHIGHGETAKE
jgi:hypothetical protein